MKQEITDNLANTEEMPCKYVVGIDLGTTNSAVSYADILSTESGKREAKLFHIPQLIAPGELGQRSVLPSFLYLPAQYELNDGCTFLPWDDKRGYAVGEIAREQGSLVPGRLVSSAKSWLCHGGVDRTANILPWGEGTDTVKVSPVEASSRYLLHIREAWNNAISEGHDDYKLETQMIILTVPASFDEVARELTVAAAHRAGFCRIKLMEEPLASFYSWLFRDGESKRNEMKPGQLILVCDVGGGTTDFTIISVIEGSEGMHFNRLSVGDHLMLGGDNMDFAIARHIEKTLFGQPGKLDSRRWHQLTHQCRKAKELLLSENENCDHIDVAIMGSGGKLIADTIKCTIQRKEVEDLIINGFFPFVKLEDTLKDNRRKGLTEWGLPYVQIPAVTRHLAAFWLKSLPLLKNETGRDVPYPDYLLFNGGSLTPSVIRNRIRSVIQNWFQDVAGAKWRPEELENSKPELAVAIGAVNYGLSRLFEGPRVGAGSPRTYYVEVATSPGEETTSKIRKAVCIVPRSSEEGLVYEVGKPAFEVLANQPVAFNVFSSSTRLGDKAGDIVHLAEDEITVLPPIHTVLRYGKKSDAIPIPVLLAVHLTEVGTLEVWCNAQNSPHRWQLQFDVRTGEIHQERVTASPETLDIGTLDSATKKIQDTFDEREGVNPDSLIKDLVSILGLNKEKWSTPIIRKLADALLQTRHGRTVSPRHEARWYNLLGFCLRPGFGDPLDEWRIRETWKVFHEGLQYPKNQQSLTEWLILWRRVAGGLLGGQQMEIYKQFSPILRSANKKGKTSKKPMKKLLVQKDREIWMTMASLERLPAEIKEDLGNLLLKTFKRKRPDQKELWSLSRFGTRIPFHGTLDKVISAHEAASWISALLAMNLEVSDTLVHAIVQLARYTGDRERDLPDTDKNNLIAWLDSIPKGKYFKELMTNPESSFEQKEQEWIFGETLPPGLILTQ